MPNNKPLTEFEDLETCELSLVDKGANNKGRFPIYKEKSIKMELEEIMKSLRESELAEEADLIEYFKKAKLSDQAVEAVKQAMRLLAAVSEEVPADLLEKLANLTGLPMPSSNTEMKKEETKKMLEEATAVEAVFKARLDAAETENKTLKASLQVIQKQLADEKDARELESWKQRVEKEAAFCPGKSYADMARTLKALYNTDPTLAEEHFQVLKASSEAIEKSGLLVEKGMRQAQGVDTSDPWSKIEKLAEALVQKSSGPMGLEEAINAVLKTAEGQRLYAEYDARITKGGL